MIPLDSNVYITFTYSSLGEIVSCLYCVVFFFFFVLLCASCFSLVLHCNSILGEDERERGVSSRGAIFLVQGGGSDTTIPKVMN